MVRKRETRVCPSKMNLSFAGCGFLGIYHVGVACCFRKYAPHLLLNNISGASVGALSACALLCDLPMDELTNTTLRVVTEARKRSLGPFHPTFKIHELLLEGLEKYLPEDAHLRVTGKLHISLTRVKDGNNEIVSQFDSREELIQALLCSAFIPFFSGVVPPMFKGQRYIDGGCSNNLPTLDENTITVSPFCGESDICPRDDTLQLFHVNIANTSVELSTSNFRRIWRILFPPRPEVMSTMCKQGFDDALRFLHRNNLISCTRCLAVQSTFVISDGYNEDEHLMYDPQCKECQRQQQEALVSNIPDTVINIFQEAIESANKGLSNWIFKHKGMKLLSVVALPYTLPLAMTIGTLNRIMEAAPQVCYSMTGLGKTLIEQLGHIISKVKKREQMKVVCNLAFSEFGGSTYSVSIESTLENPFLMLFADKFDVESCQDLTSENQKNLNFTLDLNDSDLPIDESPDPQSRAEKLLQKRPNLLSRADTGNEETFDNILKVTANHDAIMAFYFMDTNNKVKVTEIYDVTDSDFEKEDNENESEEQSSRLDLKNEDGNLSKSETLSNNSQENILDKDSSNLFSDPESEWTVDRKQEDEENYSSDNMPESDQSSIKTYSPRTCKEQHSE